MVMKKYVLTLLFIIPFTYIFSQYCGGGATTNQTITPTSVEQFTAVYASGRREFNFNAIAGYEYTFSTVGQTTMDTYLRLYSTGTGGSIIAASDDYNGTQSEITWLCTVTGTYSVLLTRWTSTNACATLSSVGVKMKYQCGNNEGSTVVSIGGGTSLSFEVPVYHYYEYGWSQMIYTQSEINTVGYIQKIRFQTDADSPLSYVAENQKIYMGHTTLSTFPSVGTKENAVSNYVSSNYTLVYDGTITWTRGWVEIDLQTPFPWNNTNNLLIKYENRENSWSSYYPSFYYTPKTNSVGLDYQDNSYPTVDGYTDNLRPNLKLVIGENSALPVELMSFDGVRNGRNNILFWQTATESNCSHFNVEKSTDGETWTNIGTINGAGTSTHMVEYEITDYKVKPIINYYRLVQYDFDGKYTKYDPISINNYDGSLYVVKITNLLGQDVGEDYIGPALIIYNDGSTKKIIK
jgi:hypothetical protein